MAIPEFSATIESQHQRLDPDNWEDVYIVGDVHGCLDEFTDLLEQLNVTATDLVVVVGDLVRKGPDSAGVIELVRDSPNIFSVRGNNEEKLLRGTKSLPELTTDDLAWIQSLPVAISFADTLIVHGGIDPRKPLADHDVDDLQNTRSLVPGGSYDRPFWFDKYAGPQRVFFGHTVLERPIVRAHAVGLDTGCVYGGTLTAYDWRADKIIQYNATETIQERPDKKFVSPPAQTP
ncbi:metallophosphoesterase family protein [Natronocalculus amylovorans]|uniref:Serine/threonine protein phosphatase n=1 Tax=Natronocalculus amylovorans TaxID=2917812 RepID=A0AAE3FWY1_9EURY|nr:metallophosphoesterase family protein [Natronocalculus amylovorans]MCL9816705.1 serine/threonine protein phosphatase [Natronocalculus amylovorans]NUE01148.1 serine/threonine protein phosphatase [Halorubraceae archaeon YAN]